LVVQALVWLVGVPLVHGVVPWELARLTARFGWAAAGPGAWNALGLFPIVVGAALLGWVLIEGLTRTPAHVDLGLTTSVLVRSGPYDWTRNPMYLAELLIWSGWAILFGSLAVAGALLAMLVGMTAIVVPREERALRTRFGPTYIMYSRAVPRWVGRTHT
jgi:protein-S-isoprenylcysteine O-methyltransferase Ste14